MTGEFFEISGSLGDATTYSYGYWRALVEAAPGTRLVGIMDPLRYIIRPMLAPDPIGTFADIAIWHCHGKFYGQIPHVGTSSIFAYLDYQLTFNGRTHSHQILDHRRLHTLARFSEAWFLIVVDDTFGRTTKYRRFIIDLATYQSC